MNISKLLIVSAENLRMKGMAMQIVLLLMFVRAGLSASIQSSFNEIMACESDDNCPHNEYCYETQVCAACYECSVYFRLPSSSGCAKTPQDCGSCENGYQDEVLSGGKVRDTCARAPTFQPETLFAGSTWNSPTMWLFGACVVMGLVVMVVFLAVWCGGMDKKWVPKMFLRAANGTYHVYSVPSAPPLPSKDCDIGRHCVEEPLVSQYVREKMVATKSVPFDTSLTKVATWRNAEQGSHAQSIGEASGYQHNQAVGFSPPELEDESTTPSTWTPETLSEGALVTSFTGLFSNGGLSNFNNNNINNSNFSNLQNFTPETSFNNSGASSNTSSTGNEGSSNTSGSTSGNTSMNGPVNIFVQGGPDQSSVHCAIMVNNVHVNEF